MILAQESVGQQRIFQAVRAAVQGICPEVLFDEDPCGAPFLFKSHDAKIWVRVFYQSMGDSTEEGQVGEIGRLMALMPKDARIYCFYPFLCTNQIEKFRIFRDRLVFFEYGALGDHLSVKSEIKIRKWMPASAEPVKTTEQREVCVKRELPVLFLDCARLSDNEIRELAELGLGLWRS